jgi:PadR family transcriptional regulator PadR
MSKPTDLVQGTLDLLILKLVALEPLHGWAISQRISQMSNDVLQVGQGSLYPALHKLEQQGWIEAEWRESENNRRAKYYTLTRDGRRAMKQEAAQWERLSASAFGRCLAAVGSSTILTPNCGITSTDKSRPTEHAGCPMTTPDMQRCANLATSRGFKRKLVRPGHGRPSSDSSKIFGSVYVGC